ncbi:hypothetical protein RI367_005475 [Sorochytrium milnesiophthora]
MSRYLHGDTNKWDIYVPQALAAARVNMHASTGRSAFEIAMDDEQQQQQRGRQLEELQLSRQEAAQQQEDAQRPAKLRYDATGTIQTLAIGKVVLLQLPPIRGKWMPQWSKPYKINAAHANSGTYRLATPDGLQKEDWIHRDCLKPVNKLYM